MFRVVEVTVEQVSELPQISLAIIPGTRIGTAVIVRDAPASYSTGNRDVWRGS